MFQRYFLSLVWCSTLSLSLAAIYPADPERYPHSAEIGKKGLLVFEIYENGDRPQHICMATDFNCTTPHGLCFDDQHKYRLVIAENPVVVEGGYQSFCGLEIENVSVNDVGKYELWKRTAAWNQSVINFAVWERDANGLICQTSYDETSKEIINNCTSLTTNPSTTELSTTERSTTMTTKRSTTMTTERSTTMTTERSTTEISAEIPNAVGIPEIILMLTVIVILIICGVVYLYKKQSRRRQFKIVFI